MAKRVVECRLINLPFSLLAHSSLKVGLGGIYGEETKISPQQFTLERICSRVYDTPSTSEEISRHWSISEYICGKESDEKPDSIRLLDLDDHLTPVRRLYTKGSYEID